MEKTLIYQKLGQYFDQYQISELLQKQTGFSKSQLFLCNSLPKTTNNWLEDIINLGEKKYPFEYIIQKAEFYGIELYVDNRVLIPRNDTEIMVQSAINIINNSHGKLNYIDIGTGSSCIPIAVLKNLSFENIQKSYVIDISTDALEVSKINLTHHKLINIVEQLDGSLLEPAENKLNSNNLVITANLPYIKDNDYDNMDKETVQYEPDLALYGGKETGFELYEKLIEQIQNLKIKNNIQQVILFIEIGFDQELYSQKYLNTLGLEFLLHKDNSGITRCIEVNI